MRVALTLAALAFALAPAAPAAAQAVSVFGSSVAEQCYQHARLGSPSLTALRDCDAALAEFGLSQADRAATLTNRGVVRLQRREGAEALADFDAALAIKPDSGETYVNRAAALVLLRRFEEAIAAADRGLALGTRDPHEAYFNRAIARELSGDLQGAYDDYTEAAALQPNWELPRIELARFSVEQR